MKNLNALCLGLLVFVVMVATTSAIKCYTCSQCNDPFDKSKATEDTCQGSCLKTKVNGVVTRVCSPIDLGDKCEDKNGVFACSCKKDLCNSASGMGISITGFCLTLLAMFLWMK